MRFSCRLQAVITSYSIHYTKLYDSFAKDKKKDSKEDKKPAAGEDKAFADVVKDMEEVKGLFTFYRKPAESKVLMEILPSQMDTDFLFAATTDQSLGENGFYASMMAGDFAFRFRSYNFV